MITRLHGGDSLSLGRQMEEQEEHMGGQGFSSDLVSLMI